KYVLFILILLKQKTQTKSSGFDKMHQYHKFSSILSIILRLCVLSPSETDFQETQQQISHAIDFDICISK
ncbi:unnamed protein product, partial [Rotaria sp. Silwood1]